MNPRQRQAIETTEGYVLVLAGAGTGKTSVLTSRLAYLLEKDLAQPYEILAVTFTNKAAQEMRHRVDQKVGGPTRHVWLGTFHSLTMRILRQYATYIGLGTKFTIIDRDDQIRLMKQILKDRNNTKEDPKRILTMIDRWKNQGFIPSKASAHTPYEQQGLKLYHEYQDRLQILNACDFGDLILHNLTLFEQYPDILQTCQGQFRYLLVDEYQDTNAAQYLWLRLLAQGSQNLCCVGDDDQSIYGWRGAEIGNILRFEKDFPDACIIRLEQNYRSTGHILAAASGLVAKNQSRLGKTLWTEGVSGERVSIQGLWSSDEEARYVVQKTRHLVESYALKNIAILVRASFQTRQFEDELLKFGIPYRVIGGFRFYERQEVRDALAYARILVYPDDGLAFERILNVPKRGIGPTTVQKIHAIANEQKIGLPKAARLFAENDAAGKTKASLLEFLDQIEQWRTLENQHTPWEWILAVLRLSGYWDMWKNDESGEARLENLQEFIHAIKTFESLSDFLEHVSLVLDQMDVTEPDVLTLMTLHGAKGLEFPIVFLPGWEEGLFPHIRAIQDRNLEEERRLGYVGISRAREKLFISYAINRYHFPGGWKPSHPSRFIRELPEDHLAHTKPKGRGGF